MFINMDYKEQLITLSLIMEKYFEHFYSNFVYETFIWCYKF